MNRAQINAPALTEEQLREAVAGRLARRGAAAEFARRHGLSDETVTSFIRGTRPPARRLADALGFKKIAVYVPVLRVVEARAWSSVTFDGAKVVVEGLELSPDTELDIPGVLVAALSTPSPGRTEFLLVNVDGRPRPPIERIVRDLLAAISPSTSSPFTCAGEAA